MSPVNHSPRPGRATPVIEDTPSPATLRGRSDTVIPLTPLPVTTTPAKKPQNDPTLAELLILLSDALSDVHSIKTTTTSSNNGYVEGAKTALLEAKTLTQKLLNEERNQILKELSDIKKLLAKPETTAQEEPSKEESNQMAKDLRDIKKLLETPKLTFAQAVTEGNTAVPQEPPSDKEKLNTERKKARKAKSKEREKFAITMSAQAAPETTKNQLKAMHAKDLIQKCQDAIKKEFKEGHIPKIHGVNKREDDTYKFHCESVKDPELLHTMDWGAIFNGVTASKRKYGLVIHGVPKNDLDPTKEDQIILRDELEEENTSRNLQAEQVFPLRRTKKQLEKPTAHHSIVILTTRIQAADDCLKRGMFIKGRYYLPEKYTPDLNIKQCYKCYGWEHMAKDCIKEHQTCDNCGNDDHEKGNCPNPTKCVNCGEAHKAWHKDCKKRDAEGARLKALKQATTEFYSE